MGLVFASMLLVGGENAHIFPRFQLVQFNNAEKATQQQNNNSSPRTMTKGIRKKWGGQKGRAKASAQLCIE